jgi:hypothetical protein
MRFRRLAHQLSQVGAQQVVVDLARRGSHDEHRHAQLCAAMCARYGGEVPKGPFHDHPAMWPGLAPRDQVLYEVVAFACIAETINAQLLTTILNRATDPRILRIVRRLLKDEVVHGKFGWAHLAAERQRGGGAFLSSLIPKMLARSVEDELFSSGPDPVDAEAIAHGEVPRTERLEIFVSGLREVIFPGFEMFGLDMAPAKEWLTKRLAGEG